MSLKNSYTGEDYNLPSSRDMVFNYTCYDGGVREMWEDVKTLPPARAEVQDSDYTRDESYPRYDMKSIDELEKFIDEGVDNPALLNVLQAFESKVYGRRTGYENFYDVSGSDVDIGRYLSGDPECMSSRRKKVRMDTNVINAVLDVSVPYSVTTEEYERAGRIIAMAIVSAESRGNMIGLTASISTLCAPLNKNKKSMHAHLLGITLKKINQRRDYTTMLFPITDIRFFRMCGFTWLARQQPYLGGGLGYPLENKIDNECMDKLFREIYGKDVKRISMLKLLKSMWDKKTDEELIEVVFKMLKGEEDV